MSAEKPSHVELPTLGYLADLGAEERGLYAEAGNFVSCEVGDYLCVQGQPHSAMSIILSGSVAITARANGEKVDLAVLGEGDVVGEMCVIDPGKASATARVSGPTELWRINRDAFETFMHEHPGVGIKIMRGLAKVMCGRVRNDSEHMLRRESELGSKFLDMDY